MAFNHTVIIVRASGTMTKHFPQFVNGQYAPSGLVTAFLRKALKMPKTIRVEILEEDTQLHGVPEAKRTYQRLIAIPTDTFVRVYSFCGYDASAAFQTSLREVAI